MKSGLLWAGLLLLAGALFYGKKAEASNGNGNGSGNSGDRDKEISNPGTANPIQEITSLPICIYLDAGGVWRYGCNRGERTKPVVDSQGLAVGAYTKRGAIL
jgi:hypothetical protein